MLRVQRPSRWRLALLLVPLLALWQVMAGAAELQGRPGPRETVVPAVQEQVNRAVSGIAAVFGRLGRDDTPADPGGSPARRTEAWLRHRWTGAVRYLEAIWTRLTARQ
ncbi:MAG: hypothetical protein L6E13_05965 [Firmicutes bacterium]|nr:hypothetical protein [Bacillota bacterium]